MIGHGTARAYLERELPTATLLYGPASVGKWTLASHLADFHRVSTVDRWQVPHGLTIDTVRLVTAYAHRAPYGAFKLIQARLDASSRQALNALLKTLEEPPPKVKFMLISSSGTLPTVASRCTVFELGELTAGQLEQIYRTQGYTAARAHRAAQFARGQVARGYDAEGSDNHHELVQQLAKALGTGDRELYDQVFKTWDARCTQMLTSLFLECLTQRWAQFNEADGCGLHRDRRRVWSMVSAVGRLNLARPRLGVRVALEPFLERR